MKYKLKAAMITPLTDAGYISGGNMTLSVPTRSQGAQEQMFRMVWNVTAEALQTSNSRGEANLRRASSPPLKTNGEWQIADPALPWFDELSDADPTTGVEVDGAGGTAVLARWERKLVSNYCIDTSTAKPNLFDTKAALQSILDDALAYYGRV